MNYLITFDNLTVLSVFPVSPDTEVLGSSDHIITTLDNARLMLAAVGVDTAPLDNITETNQ